jgi:carboxylesterase
MRVAQFARTSPGAPARRLHNPFGRLSRVSGELVGQGPARALAAQGRAPGVLALHGFGGTQREIELVFEVATELGLAASAPLLPGHGTRVAELAQTGFSDWLSAAERELETLSARGKVVVAGLSMGSLVAAHLAAVRPEEVAGLVLLANAAWLKAPFPAWALQVVHSLGLPDFLMPKKGPDIEDPTMRSSHLGYDSHPVHAAIRVLEAGRAVRRELPKVVCPTLILHGTKDSVCPVSNAWRVAERLGTRDVRVVILPHSRHIITRDVEREQVRREIAQFLGRIAEH